LALILLIYIYLVTTDISHDSSLTVPANGKSALLICNNIIVTKTHLIDLFTNLQHPWSRLHLLKLQNLRQVTKLTETFQERFTNVLIKL